MSENNTNKMQDMCIINISDTDILIFVPIPKGYKVTSFKLENHKCTKVGYLSNFNRLKCFDEWRKTVPNIEMKFRELLVEKGFDIKKHSNPIAFLGQLQTNI